MTKVKGPIMTNASRTKEHYQATERLYDATYKCAYLLDVFGDSLASREGYKEINGIEAVHFYLCHKHHWKPSDVRAMTSDDLRFLLSEEMHGWTAPKAARG